ncbi:MAG: ribonuclease P protein component [Coriobacteriia bacterium]|nr:ribonuclease P protein component [Coriobacteriia bacterium]
MSTIKSSRDIQAIFSRSRRVAHPLVVALIARTPEGRGREGRVVFVAGKRIGNAVTRNRAKRVLRAAYRIRGGSWPGYDIALVAREGTGTAKPDELLAALEDVVSRGGAA